MNARKTERVVIGVLAVGVLLALVWAAQAQEKDEKDLWVVSIRHLVLAPGERVIGFDVRLKTAMITSLPKVPWGWGVTIDNDLSWNTRVSGNIGIGVAAFENENDASEFFRDFLLIEKAPKEIYGVSSQPFDITVEIMTTADFVSTKRIFFGKEDLLLRKR